MIESEYGEINNVLGTIETTGPFSSTSVQELPVVLGPGIFEVDNSTKSYQLRFESSGNNVDNIRLYGVKIEYTTERTQ